MSTNHGLHPGIYFGMAASTYHSDPALSRSNIVALNDTPFTYWDQSWMNRERKIKLPSDEMEFGEAFHCQMFEPAKFEKDYFVFPTDKWDDGKKMITKESHDVILSAIKVLREGKDSKLFLSGGLPEVTIVFDMHGLRWRVRIDWLTPVVIVDFKTIYSLAVGVIKNHFDRFGYDVQMYLYKAAVKRLKEQLATGEAHVFGHVNPEWFAKFMNAEMNDFIFIMQRKTAPYPYAPLFPEDDTERSGEDKTLRAVDIFNENWKKHGQKPWPVSDGKLKRFSMFYGMVTER